MGRRARCLFPQPARRIDRIGRQERRRRNIEYAGLDKHPVEPSDKLAMLGSIEPVPEGEPQHGEEHSVINAVDGRRVTSVVEKQFGIFDGFCGLPEAEFDDGLSLFDGRLSGVDAVF